MLKIFPVPICVCVRLKLKEKSHEKRQKQKTKHKNPATACVEILSAQWEDEQGLITVNGVQGLARMTFPFRSTPCRV